MCINMAGSKFRDSFRTPLHNPLALARATNTETGVTLFIHDIKVITEFGQCQAQVSLLSRSGFKLSRVREELYFERIKQFGFSFFSFMAIDFTSHLHQTKRKVLLWQTFMQMTINYLKSFHIILETRIYEIYFYGFEARLNNPYSFLL